MGQKVSPVGLRVGVIRDWDAKWFFDQKEVPEVLQEDLQIRDLLSDKFHNAAVSKVVIERKSKDKIDIILNTAKPGVIIGQDGKKKLEVVNELEKLTNKSVMLNIVEIRKPEVDAFLVARNIAEQLENRASFRRAQKVAIQRAIKNGALGCKTMVSGRLGGADMARSEGYSEGNVPLHTLRADIDYAHAEANTTYGKLGIKVWIYKGEVLPKKKGE
ncbi:30S ribosomal protein S3 [Mycoplasmatota bacterium]|nr:30S ribosomal protein S3 [Mycoplasmatota bacterium]